MSDPYHYGPSSIVDIRSRQAAMASCIGLPHSMSRTYLSVPQWQQDKDPTG